MKYLLHIAILLLVCHFGYSQYFPAARTTGNSGTGGNIDVKHHRFEWNIDPSQSKRISGSVTTYFETTQSGVKKITFDLNKTSFNNSNLIVKYHGTNCSISFPASGYTDILTITLPVTLGNGVLDSVTIFYNGVPPAVNGQAEGCQQKNVKVSSVNYPIFYTLSESYEDKDWWPCKADMQDKIDSLTFIITTPSSFRPAANGVLISEVTSGSNKVYTFKHKYPIASYLVAVAVANYKVYNRGTVNIGGTNMPVEYYILNARNPTSGQLNTMDACKQELVEFSNLFGDYPFKNEKYGMYEFAWGGGMEHQTFSAMGWSSFTNAGVIAHELMHQWFGDKVTMATWHHLWLAEGFASYGEVLAGEKVPSTGLNPVSIRSSLKSAANSSSERGYGCVIPQANIENSNALWNSQYGNSVYDRGGMVVSMLRTLLGDEKFFQACRNYLNDPVLQYASATTADLQAHMEAVTGGFDLTSFFDSFAYGNGYPTYSGANTINWQAVGTDKIRFGVYSQGKSSGSDVGYYSAVIPLRVQGSGGKDTVIVLYDRGPEGVSVGGDGIVYGNSATPTVYLGFTPTTVTFDPYNMSLATGTALQTTVLATEITNFDVKLLDEKVKATLDLADYESVRSITLESGADGSSFVSSGLMKSMGMGNYMLEIASHPTTTFYRARILLQSGEVLYSRVVRIGGAPQQPSVSLVANPVSGVLRLRSQGDGNRFSYQIADFNGRTLKRGTLNFNTLSEVDLENLQKGHYLLTVQSGSWNHTIRFMLQ